MKRKKNNKFIIVLILIIGIAFAYISTNLSILGRSNFGKSNWKMYFDNIRVVSGSEFVDNMPTTVGDTTTSLNFEVTLNNPNDTFSFYVDIVNDGDVDSMVNLINKSQYDDSYCEFNVTYYDLVELHDYDYLSAGTRDTLLVSVKYKSDIDYDTLVSNKDSVNVRLDLEYTIATKDKKEIEHAANSFETDSWDVIERAVSFGKYPYQVGDTKKINLDGFGEHTLRVANISSPDVCDTEGFSQTACGFVIEFADIIAMRNYQPISYNYTYTYNGGWNTGGWPDSTMREYVMTTIFTSLPEELQKIIKDTKVVSSHGQFNTDNFVSYDKLYFLAPEEIITDPDNDFMTNDTSLGSTRLLDYYINATKDNEVGRKPYQGYRDFWWLRSAKKDDYMKYYTCTHVGRISNDYAVYEHGISPAFKIN